MQKPKLQTSNYGISKTENTIIKTIKKNKLVIFTPRELKGLLNYNPTNILQQLKRKQIITNLKRNAYTLTENIKENLFQISTETINPSYISFWTALSYYGFTEQQTQTIQLITTKQYKSIIIKNHKIIPTKFKINRFFAYKKINHFNIAEKEKAIIDSLAYPNNAGGFNETIKCLKNAWPEINKQKFIEYLKRYNNKALNARVGYILEKLKLKKINLEIPTTYTLLNKEKSKTNKLNKEYRIIINEEIA